MTTTVSERKAIEVARLRAAAARAMDALKSYAIDKGGRFAVFGSFARGDIVHSSDFDVMVEFPPLLERAAGLRAETICRDVGLVPDVHLASESSDGLKARVARDAVFLP